MLFQPLLERLSSSNDRHRKLAADFLDHLLRECPERMAPLFPHLPDLCRPALEAQAHDKSEADHMEARKIMKAIWDRYECQHRTAVAPPLPTRTHSMSRGSNTAMPYADNSFSRSRGAEAGPSMAPRQRSQHSMHAENGPEAGAGVPPQAWDQGVAYGA